MIQSLLIGTGITAISTLGALALVLWYFDPTATGSLGIILFFVSFIGAIVSTLALIGYWIRRQKRPSTTQDFWDSLRQAGLAGVLLGGLLLLSSNHIYHWWYLPIGIFLILVIEIYLRVKVE